MTILNRGSRAHRDRTKYNRKTMGNETYDTALIKEARILHEMPVAEMIHDLMKEGILDSEELSINLLKWIGWKNDKDLEEFMDNYYPDIVMETLKFLAKQK